MEAEREMGFGAPDDQPGFFDLIDEFTAKVEQRRKERGSESEEEEA